MKKKKLHTLNIFGSDINTDVALSRDEMKKIMAGSGGGGNCPTGFDSCKCYDYMGGPLLGTVCCSEDIGLLSCCWAHYNDTNYVDCT